ncbi:hypothetical protein Poli38472_002921 [Pythium oligandrum]|uniref:EF-hand domain-containing protein n=1 Tax=Pythium oligandrum TaxID=41045 RepID=A0A8K1C5V1_PYTOL|nr:hypothetical protein Poli38472_002921 [Pythium oligandrum]|eukprot:TMW56996.1 hypothetical protein Poli38472_002921 [Pythium oligandrum]
MDLSPREFGMFLVSHADQKDMEMWVARVDRLRDMKGHITEEEFMNFMTFLDHLDEFKVAIDLVMQAKGLNKGQFRRAVRAALRGQKGDAFITPLQVDILFILFDVDGDGHLTAKEFLDIMQKRKDGGFNERRDTGAFEFLVRVKECIEAQM